MAENLRQNYSTDFEVRSLVILDTEDPLECSLEVSVRAMRGLVDVMHVGMWALLRWGLCPFCPYLLFESVAAPMIPGSTLVVSTCVC